MPVVTIPLYEGHPEIKGIFAGGCVERGDGSSFRAKAHTHTKGEYKGWICIRSPKRLSFKSLLIHEAAHAITGEGHTDKWRAKIKELGGRLEYYETKEYFQLQRAGVHVFRKVGKREAKQMIKERKLMLAKRYEQSN